MADIIRWAVSTFSIVVKMFHDSVSEVGVPSYYLCCFIYIIPDKAEKWYDVSRHIQLDMSKYKKIKIYYLSCPTYSLTVV